MWLYLGLLVLPPGGAAATHFTPRARPAIYCAVGFALIVLIGFRYHVGCDWNDYLLMSLRSERLTLGQALTINEPGYMLINWVTAQFGLSVAAVNTVCAAILVIGLMLFCTGSPKPWLALFISMPIVVLLAGFSATRQSVAVGLFLLALALHIRSRPLWTVLAVLIVGVTFHYSALVLLPLPLLMRLTPPRRAASVLALVAAAGSCAALLLMMLPPIADIAASHPRSSGAWLRAIPIVLSLLAFPIVWRRPDLSEAEQSTLFWLATFAIGCLICGIASPFVMDRLGFYTIPLQIMVLTHIADKASPLPAHRALNAAISTPFLALFLGWFLLGTTAACYTPYRTILSQPQMLLLENTRRAFKFNHITDTWGVLQPFVADATVRANSNESASNPKGITIE